MAEAWADQLPAVQGSHELVEAPRTPEKVPAGQLVQLEEPFAVEKVPSTQPKHQAHDESEYLPAGHASHPTAPMKDSDLNPAGQLEQVELSLAPIAVENVPPAQGRHNPDSESENVPAGHASQCSAPENEEVPGGQLVQLEEPSAVEKVPSTQPMHISHDVFDHAPAGHASHLSAPMLEKDPAGQLEQVESSLAPIAVENVPPAQETQPT